MFVGAHSCLQVFLRSYKRICPNPFTDIQSQFIPIVFKET